MNPLFQMFIQQTIAKNPQAKQLYDSLRGKSPMELRQYAENVAKGKGIDLKQFMNGYGVNI